MAPITFASIVEEELQQEAALTRSREKPLALIQVEAVLGVNVTQRFSIRGISARGV